MHFTPTGASLNMVERFFTSSGPSDSRIKRDSFTSVAELGLTIDLYNAEPKPLVWTVDAKDILAKMTRAKRLWRWLRNMRKTNSRTTRGVLVAAGCGLILDLLVLPVASPRATTWS
jgi:hypothetical protein